MKKIGEYTTRGIITSSDTETHRIQLFDGRFDTGYRVKSFDVAMSDRDNGNQFIASVKLMTEPDDNNRYWNFGKNTQIAWAGCGWDADTYYNNYEFRTMIDPDNMIVEDLYIGALVYNDQAVEVNYMITLEKYDITDWQGALAMVRNRSQGAPP